MNILFSASRNNLNQPWANLNAVTGVKLYGRNPNLPLTPTVADLWPAGQLVRSVPASVFTIGLSSDSVNDTDAGSGAETVLVSYLDTNYAPQTWTGTLNGQTLVTGPGSVWRINGVSVVTAGSGGANAGNIYVFDNTATLTGGVPTSSKLFAQIGIGDNVAHLGMYTVPKGQQVFLSQFTFDLTNGTTTNYYARVLLGIAEYVGTPGLGYLMPWKRFVIAGVSSSSQEWVEPVLFEAITQGSEIRFQASASVAGAELVVVAELIQSNYPTITSQGNP